MRVGEMVIMVDYIDAKDWYVAEIAQVLGDCFTVNGFTTTGVPLAGYKSASRKGRARALNGMSFLSQDLVQGQRQKQRRGHHHPAIAPQRKGKILVELEDSHR